MSNGFRDDWHILRYLVRSRVSPTRQAKHHLSFVVNRDNLDRSPPYYLLRRTATGSSSCFCSSNFWSTMTTFIGSPPLPRNEITGHRHQIVTVWEGGGDKQHNSTFITFIVTTICPADGSGKYTQLGAYSLLFTHNLRTITHFINTDSRRVSRFPIYTSARKPHLESPSTWPTSLISPPARETPQQRTCSPRQPSRHRHHCE